MNIPVDILTTLGLALFAQSAERLVAEHSDNGSCRATTNFHTTDCLDTFGPYRLAVASDTVAMLHCCGWQICIGGST
jgi:hypothetical protein